MLTISSVRQYEYRLIYFERVSNSQNGDRQGRHDICCQVCMMIDCWWLINVWLNEKTKLRIAVTKHNQSQSKKIQPDIITCQDIRTANEWVCSWFSVLFGVMLAVDCENAT